MANDWPVQFKLIEQAVLIGGTLNKVSASLPRMKPSKFEKNLCCCGDINWSFANGGRLALSTIEE